MRIRRLARPDRHSIEDLIRSDDTFNQEEVAVALELVDSACEHPGRDYNVLVCEDGDRILGYVCFGPTPMTIGTWDLYWIATHRAARGRGVATRLVDAMQAELQVLGARIVRLETSQLESYGAARSFYARLGFVEVGRIADFYRQGDDLVTLAKRLDVPAEAALPLPRRAQM
jgi:ribosomal protein S18 acetylase RimI-like enzyme